MQQTEKKINVFCRFIRNRTVCLDSYPEKEAAPIGTASLLYRHLYSYISARHSRRANFFAFFQNHCPQTPFPSGNKWGNAFETNSLFKKFFLFFLKNRLRFGIPIPNKWRDKIFLRFRGCIWLFSVGISEGTFWASKIKALNQKIFFKIFVKTGCVSASQFQISEGVLQTAKYFLKQGWNLPVPSGNKWRGFSEQTK